MVTKVHFMYSGRNSIIEASFTSNQRTRIKVYLANQVFSSIQLLSPLEAGSKRTLSGDDTKNQRGSQAPESSKKSRTLNYSSVQSLSLVQLFVTPWTAACQASLSITNSRSPPKPMSIESVMPSSHLILCRPLLLLPSIFPSIRVFSNESALHIRWPNYRSFSFSISPSNEYLGLISFRISLQLLSRVFSNTTVRKHQFFCAQLSL